MNIDDPMPSGNPDECMKCGRLRSEHDGIINKCPTGYGYFKRKYDFDGVLETDYTDEPMCPWCGAKYTIDDHYDCYKPDEDIEIECPECQEPFYSSASVEYHFTTRRKDVEGEKRKEEERRRKDEEYRAAERLKCEPYTPGMRVRILTENWGGQYKDMLGTVTNHELDHRFPRVHVLVDPHEVEKYVKDWERGMVTVTDRVLDLRADDVEKL